MYTGMLRLIDKDTSFGEASSRTQATDPNRRETLRIRTPLPGLRGEAKWLRKLYLSHGHSVRRTRSATPWSAKALTREVTPGCVSRRGRGTCLFSGAVCEGARGRPGLREALRWTLIVRAEVGPIHRLPCRSLARADAYSSLLTHPGLSPGR